MRTLYCLYQESSKPSKTNSKFLLNFGVQQLYFFYVMLYNAMSCHVMSIAILAISFHVMLCYANYLIYFYSYFLKNIIFSVGGR